jgi:hypothetical protein
MIQKGFYNQRIHGENRKSERRIFPGRQYRGAGCQAVKLSSLVIRVRAGVKQISALRACHGSSFTTTSQRQCNLRWQGSRFHNSISWHFACERCQSRCSWDTRRKRDAGTLTVLLIQWYLSALTMRSNSTPRTSSRLRLRVLIALFGCIQKDS